MANRSHDGRHCTGSRRPPLHPLPDSIMNTKLHNNSKFKNSKRKKKKKRNLSSNRVRPSLYVHESLIREILLRLPVNSVLKLRAVCKLWNSLTRDLHFSHQHTKLNCSDSRSALLINYKKSQVNHDLHCHGQDRRLLISPERKFSMHLNFSPINHHYWFSNSCHGLVCIHEDNKTGNFRLVNPAIGESVRLKFPTPSPRDLCTIALVYDDSVERYKIVRVFYRDSGMDRTGCQILTLCSGSPTWRDIGDAPISLYFDRVPVVVGATVYWEVCHYHMGAECAVSLDVRREKFDVVVTPEGMTDTTQMVLGAELGGHFCLVYQEERYLYLQILMDHGGANRRTWKGYRIYLQKMEDFCHVEVVSMRDGKLLLASMYDSCFHVYDLDGGKFLGEPMKMEFQDFIQSYFESLVSPLAIRGMRRNE